MTQSETGTLGLELENDAGTTLIEFPPGDDRAFSVGSSKNASMRLLRPGVAPIEFYVQRDDNALWLVPAYASVELRLDARRVSTRRRIAGRCLLELAQEIIVLRVHEGLELEELRERATDDFMQTRRLVRPQHYVEDLPAEGDPTRIAMPALGHSTDPIAFCQTEAVPVVPFMPEDDVPLWQKTVPIPKFRATTWVSESAPTHEPALQAPAQTPRVDRDRTVLDLPPAKPEPQPKPATAAQNLKKLSLRAPAFVSELGVLAKRRPLAVGLGALTVALAIAFSLVAATRSKAPDHQKPGAAASAAPRGSTTAAATRPTASSVPSVRVHRVSPAPVPAASGGPAGVSGPVDPELAEATEHLVAGRDAQARAAYERLSRRSPDEPVFAVAAHLLERMAACTDPNVRVEVSCPKVKR